MIAFIKEFLSIRNKSLAHASVQEEAFYDHLIKKLNPNFDELKQRFNFMNNYPLIVPEQLESIDGSKIKFKSISLMGSDVPCNISLFSHIQLKIKNVHIGNFLGQYLNLYPFINFEFCEQCNCRRLFMFDTFSDSKLLLNDFYNHSYTCDEQYLRDLQMLFQQ